MTPSCHPALEYLARMVRAGGPRQADYPALDFHLEQLVLDTDADTELWRQWVLLREAWFGDSAAETLVGSLLAHANGELYTASLVAGIVSWNTPLDQSETRWDRYLMQQGLFQAYRKRPAVLREQLEMALDVSEHVRLLHTGNGLGQDVRCVLDTVDPWRVTAICLEADAVLRLAGSERRQDYAADWIFPEPNTWFKDAKMGMELAWFPWCMDQLSDKNFCMAMQTMLSCMKCGAEIIYCHTLPDNTSLAVAKAFGLWEVQSRNRSSMLHLILQPSLAHRMRYLRCDERPGEVVVRVGV